MRSICSGVRFRPRIAADIFSARVESPSVFCIARRARFAHGSCVPISTRSASSFRRTNAERGLPLRYGLSRRAPGESDSLIRFATNSPSKRAEKDDRLCASRLACRPRNRCIGQAGDLHLSAHQALDGLAVAESRRLVRTEAELEVVDLGHEPNYAWVPEERHANQDPPEPDYVIGGRDVALEHGINRLRIRK
jgi:hypothetical protein